MLQAIWVFHPESPGERVLVVRGLLGRLLKPRHFATFREVEIYREYTAAQRSNHQ